MIKVSSNRILAILVYLIDARTCLALFFSIIFFSSFSYADQPFNVFVKRECNATDSITGFGATASIGYPNSLLKNELISSFNYAEILDQTGVMHEFLSLDTGVRLGVYGKAFFILRLVLMHSNYFWMMHEMMTISMIREKTTV
ncbi:MAG: hypothetical protein ACI9LX_001887 [Paraglaciecola sp.]